jgi:DsbC/DsbD-like thiol-disulfide interchange protein
VLVVGQSSALRGTARTDPVMAVVRLKVPADADPYVLEAVITRAICGAVERPMTAEVTVLPGRRRKAKGRTRKHAFVALLHSSTPTDAGALVRAAEKVSRAAVRQRFGSTASARVRPVGAGAELLASWCSVRGTPRRIHP